MPTHSDDQVAIADAMAAIADAMAAIAAASTAAASASTAAASAATAASACAAAAADSAAAAASSSAAAADAVKESETDPAEKFIKGMMDFVKVILPTTFIGLNLATLDQHSLAADNILCDVGVSGAKNLLKYAMPSFGFLAASLAIGFTFRTVASQLKLIEARKQPADRIYPSLLKFAVLAQTVTAGIGIALAGFATVTSIEIRSGRFGCGGEGLAVAGVVSGLLSSSLVMVILAALFVVFGYIFITKNN